MPSFAHLADVHIGATFRDPKLREFNMRAFEQAIDKVIEKKVDFVIIAGDLFHVNIPDMDAVDRAVKKLKQVQDVQIPMYIIYGSHDYSPIESSVIDVLTSAGLFTKVVKANQAQDGTINLQFTTDEKTGAKIVGLSARKNNMDITFYNQLNRKSLEQEPGFKVFVYHAALTEFKPEALSEMASIPLSLFPKGFQYYAGGHVHRRFEKHIPQYGLFAEPGALFGTSYTDLENQEPKGFYLVHFENEKLSKTEFIPVSVAETEVVKVNVDRQTAQEAQDTIKRALEKAQVEGRIVLLKVKGELKSGKPTDIAFDDIRSRVLEKGAELIFINRSKLTSKQVSEARVKADSKQEIEDKVFKEQLQDQNEFSVQLAAQLLKALREENIGLTRQQYEEKVRARAMGVLDSHGVFNENQQA